jgi:hypothetical protein
MLGPKGRKEIATSVRAWRLKAHSISEARRADTTPRQRISRKECRPSGACSRRLITPHALTDVAIALRAFGAHCRLPLDLTSCAYELY